jgi:ArsR family transcriptional regulator
VTTKQRAVVFKALGHPARLAMVDRIAQGECCVWELKELPETKKLSGPTVSQHLLVLKNAGIVGDEKRGKKIFHHLLMTGAANLAP